MKSDYPLSLPEDTIAVWNFSEIYTRNNCDMIQSYFHNTAQIPINMHSHLFYELNIIMEGEGWHYIENQNFDIRVGDVFILPPEIKHGYWSNENLKIFHMVLGPVFMSKYESELNLLPSYNYMFKIETLVRSNYPERLFLHLEKEDFERLSVDLEELCFLECCNYSERETLKNSKAMYVIAMLSHHMSTVRREKAQQKKTSVQMNYIVDCMEYINLNFSEKITTEMLCERFNMSRSTLLRNFKKLCNMSPSEYQLKCRLEHGKYLLETTNDTILDIALSCGFYDNSHFVKFFSKEHGINPNLYRKQIASRKSEI